MADWEVMAHEITLPIAAEDPITIPSGWEPIGTLARQGNEAVVLCRRQADAPAPPTDVPVLDSLSPSTLPAGGTPATVNVTGSNFDSSCTINIDGAPRATFYMDTTHLEYTARPDLASSGTEQVTVVGAAGTSNALTFTFT